MTHIIWVIFYGKIGKILTFLILWKYLTGLFRCWMKKTTRSLSPHWQFAFSTPNVPMLMDWRLQFPRQNDSLLTERLISSLLLKNWNCNFIITCHSCVYFINRINQLSQKYGSSFRRTGTVLSPKSSYEGQDSPWNSVLTTESFL